MNVKFMLWLYNKIYMIAYVFSQVVSEETRPFVINQTRAQNLITSLPQDGCYG